MKVYALAITAGIAMWLFLDLATPLDGWSVTTIAALAAIIVGILADENTDQTQ